MVSPFNFFAVKFLCGGAGEIVTRIRVVENLNKQEGKLELGDVRIPSPDNTVLLLSCLRGDESWFKARMVKLSDDWQIDGPAGSKMARLWCLGTQAQALQMLELRASSLTALTFS